MNAYQKAKQRARDKAVEWQMNFCEQNFSWGELVAWQDYFRALAKRTGLVKEFENEGII